MTKQKSTKRALLLSALSLLMCVSMLIGSTFAWFTDSVTSAGNKIVAGTLDVDLYLWNAADNSTEITNESAPIFGGANSVAAQNNAADTLWEPGKTQVVYLSIKNNGNLDLKYKVALNVVNPDGGKDLYKVMKYNIIEDATYGSVSAWNATDSKSVVIGTNATQANDVELKAGAEHYFALAVHMDEQAGNEYQGGEVNFDLTVLATQLASESDSFDNQYDKDAKYPDIPDVWDGTTVDTSWYNDNDTEFTIATAEEFVGFAKLANEGNTFSGKTIELENSIDLNGEEWVAIAQFSGDLNGNGHEISNFSIDATSTRGGLFTKLSWATVKDLTLSDIDATVGTRFGTLTYSVDQTTIENVNVSNINITTTNKDSLVSGLFCAGTVNSTETVNNCTVENMTVNAQNGAALIGGIATFVQKNGTEAEGTNIFDNLHVKNFKVIANDTDGQCGIGGIFAQTQSVWQNPRFNNCSVTGLDVTATGTIDVGGLICYPGSYTYAENCTTEGKIDVSGVTSANNYAGGFFGDYGWGDNVGKGDHMVTNCTADVDIVTKVASAGGFVGSGTNSEGRNKNITLTNCKAMGTVTVVDGGTANIGGFAGQTDRGIYVNCSTAQEPFIGKVLDGYTLTDDGNGTLTVAK